MKRADQIETKDIFLAQGQDSNVIEDEVKEVKIKSYETPVANVIVAGNLVVDGVVASVRVDGDMPEVLWDLGMKVHATLGDSVMTGFCRFGNWLRKNSVFLAMTNTKKG